MNNQQRAEKAIRRWMPQAPDVWDECARQAVTELDNAGLIMPDPAKPAVTSIEGYHTYHPWAIWHAEGLTINCDYEGTIYIDDETGRNISMSPEQARSLVSALIAAANHAEKDEDDA